MVRLGILGAIIAGAVFLTLPMLRGQPSAPISPGERSGVDPVAEEASLQNQLAVQRAMYYARDYMKSNDPAKFAQAVHVLEEQVRFINGHAVYLGLLRDAYRAHVRNLLVQRQNAQAEKYRQRLAIIDSTANSDPSLRPIADKKTSGPSAVAKPSDVISPKEKPSGVSGGPIFRAKNEDAFDLSNRLMPDAAERQKEAKAWLARADAAYAAVPRQFAQARLLYEKAYLADPASVADSQHRWAYCKMIYVADQLNQPADVNLLKALHSEAQSAITMAPPLLKDHGQRLLTKIEELSKNPAAAAGAVDRRYQIWPAKPYGQGWMVTETTNFRIIHKQPEELVEKVAKVAEKTRYEMFQKWFGKAGPEWNAKCEIHLHANKEDYARATGQTPNSPGHARIDTEGSVGRVVGRRLEMRVDNPAMLEAVLPHETTHVVLAGQFDGKPVPRWADEGMAVLTEPDDKVELQRRNLFRCQRDLFKVRDLMGLPDYPESKKVSAFYAQSVVLVEYLTKLKGPQVFTAFLRDGLKGGYDAALRKHYGWDFNALQDNWGRHLTAEVNRLSAIAAGR